MRPELETPHARLERVDVDKLVQMARLVAAVPAVGDAMTPLQYGVAVPSGMEMLVLANRSHAKWHPRSVAGLTDCDGAFPHSKRKKVGEGLVEYGLDSMYGYFAAGHSGSVPVYVDGEPGAVLEMDDGIFQGKVLAFKAILQLSCSCGFQGNVHSFGFRRSSMISRGRAAFPMPDVYSRGSWFTARSMGTSPKFPSENLCWVQKPSILPSLIADAVSIDGVLLFVLKILLGPLVSGAGSLESGFGSHQERQICNGHNSIQSGERDEM